MATARCQETTAGSGEVRTGPTVAQIFRQYGSEYRSHHYLTPAQWKAMLDIEQCRTPALGGRVEECDHCGDQHLLWNSCNNPHCPTCGSMKRAAWLDARRSDLLPVGYFHVVFTLDHALLPLVAGNAEVAYQTLFSAAAGTLQTFAADRGGLLGVTAVLHTWDQKLSLHPHVHCLVPAGMLSADHQRWIPTRSRFLFPVKALSKVFRARFLDQLTGLLDAGNLQLPIDLTPDGAQTLLSQSRRQPWVVYSQPPLGGPDAVLQYLARYAYRVAISNSRIVGIEDGNVAFTYKDRDHGNVVCTATVPADEFLRRFLLHVLPPGFRRIRHFGFLANSNRAVLLSRCFELLGRTPPPPASRRPRKNARTLMLELTGVDIALCTACGIGTLHTALRIEPQHPPCACTLNPSREATNTS